MANQFYDNFVLQNKFEDMLDTHVDYNQFLTHDNSLVANPGMKILVNKYDITGDVEDLAMGVGNTDTLETVLTPTEYEVGVTQGRFMYYDEQAMRDPVVVETGLRGMAAKMTNDFVTKAIAEMDKATLAVTGPMDFDTVVDAIAEMNLEMGQESGLYMLINPAENADLRKNLGAWLSYVEAYARTGYIGSVSGVNVYNSKAVPADTAFVGTREAVTLFTKRGNTIEQDREPNIRQNTIYGRKVALVALTDATKIVKVTID